MSQRDAAQLRLILLGGLAAFYVALTFRAFVAVVAAPYAFERPAGERRMPEDPS